MLQFNLFHGNNSALLSGGQLHVPENGDTSDPRKPLGSDPEITSTSTTTGRPLIRQYCYTNMIHFP